MARRWNKPAFSVAMSWMERMLAWRMLTDAWRDSLGGGGSARSRVGKCAGWTDYVGRGFEFETLVRKLPRLLVSWANRLRNSSSCLSSSGLMLSDVMTSVSFVRILLKRNGRGLVSVERGGMGRRGKNFERVGYGGELNNGWEVLQTSRPRRGAAPGKLQQGCLNKTLTLTNLATMMQ